jgi:hypothetical protein
MWHRFFHSNYFHIVITLLNVILIDSCLAANGLTIRKKNIYLYSHKPRWIFIVLADWKNSPWADMSLHSDTSFWFRANQSLLFLLNAVCLTEKLRYECALFTYIRVITKLPNSEQSYKGKVKTYTILCTHSYLNFSVKHTALRRKSI